MKKYSSLPFISWIMIIIIILKSMFDNSSIHYFSVTSILYCLSNFLFPFSLLLCVLFIFDWVLKLCIETLWNNSKHSIILFWNNFLNHGEFRFASLLVCACSVVADSLWLRGPTRILCVWNFPGKNTAETGFFTGEGYQCWVTLIQFKG